MKRDMGQHSNANDGKKDIKDNMTVETDNIDQVEKEADSETSEVIDEYTLLKNKYDELQKKHDEQSDSYLRLNAEFDNFPESTLKEKS